MANLLGDPAWPQLHPQPYTDTPWPGLQCELAPDNARVLRATRLHLGPDVATPPCRPGARLDPTSLRPATPPDTLHLRLLRHNPRCSQRGLTMRLRKNDSYYYTSSTCFTLQFDYLIPPMGMDKCCANNVDNNNVHKADMVMNGLHISVYASETLGWCGGHVHRRLMSKMLGRIGDSPPIKFGTYRCDACAVSCTLKWDMATFMEYKGLPLQQAVDYYVRA
uniref:Uncharacterized protein n=1 Tax=Zea mays TaxID=4577 RepID=A0A804PWZ3_MAIZE